MNKIISLLTITIVTLIIASGCNSSSSSSSNTNSEYSFCNKHSQMYHPDNKMCTKCRDEQSIKGWSGKKVDIK